MDSFPKEVLFAISLYLPPWYLLTINKHFSTIYNEYYYKRYIEWYYPNINFNPKLSYKELCQNSLKEGEIWKRNTTHNSIKNLRIRGMKIFTLSYNKDKYLILKFNSDLYLYDKNKRTSYLIDTEVTDIITSSYIKDNKWYYIDYLCNKRLIYESEDNFNNISFSEIILQGMYASTNYILYKYQNGTLIQKGFDKKIIKITADSCGVNILFENKDLICYNYLLNEVSTISNVTLLKSFCFKKENNYYLLHKKEYSTGTKITLDLLPELAGRIINSIISLRMKMYILTDKGLFTLYKITEGKYQYKETLSKYKIKNIHGNVYGTYEIH